MDRIKELISKMTLEEKASLCSGADNWHTKEQTTEHSVSYDGGRPSRTEKAGRGNGSSGIE